VFVGERGRERESEGSVMQRIAVAVCCSVLQLQCRDICRRVTRGCCLLQGVCVYVCVCV